MEAGEFWTSSPIPQVKVVLMAAKSGLISNKTTLSKVSKVVVTVMALCVTVATASDHPPLTENDARGYAQFW